MMLEPEKIKVDNPFSIEIDRSIYWLALSKKWRESEHKAFETGRLRVSVIDICNLDCSYCYNEGICDAEKKRISPSDLEQILDAISPEVKSIKIVGGEPLLHPNIVELLEVSKKYAPTTITTNGILLGKYAKKISELGIDGVTVSLDDTDPESFRTLTKTDPAFYQRVLSGIQALVESGYERKNIQLNAVVSKQNFPNLKKVIDLASRLGLGKVNLMNFIKVDCVNDSDIVAPEKIEEYVESIADSSEYVSASRHRYKVGKTDVDVVWQYCTLGCDVCRTEGFIRVTPSYEFKYCVADKAGVSFEKELKSNDIKGLRERFYEAKSMMGCFKPHSNLSTDAFLAP